MTASLSRMMHGVEHKDLLPMPIFKHIFQLSTLAGIKLIFRFPYIWILWLNPSWFQRRVILYPSLQNHNWSPHEVWFWDWEWWCYTRAWRGMRRFVTPEWRSLGRAEASHTGELIAWENWDKRRGCALVYVESVGRASVLMCEEGLAYCESLMAT